MSKPFQPRLLESMGRNKDKTAIEYANLAITYRQLHSSSNAVTSALSGINIKAGSMVAIALKSKVQFITAMIGCMNARACFVPIDTSLPTVRLEAMLHDVQPVCLITTREEMVFNTGAAATIYMDEEMTAVDNIDYPVPDAEDSLYVYFTSGSTGKPKGIIGKNKCLLQFLEWELGAFNIDENIRVSQLISPWFDAFLRDIFVPLLSGGTVCIPPEEKDWLTPDNLAQWLNDKRISLVHCVPSVFRLLNAAKLTAACFQSLQYVLLSGEKIIPAELKNWYQVFGDRIQLVNLYGATESTMIRSFYLIKPEDAAAVKIPAGKPINDTEFLLMNEEQKPVRKLVTGEIFIVSDYICKGYLNNPVLTAEKFITLPDGRRAFRTGDRGRILADGNLDLLGREDRQIKLNGIRIEPGEIENVLLSSGLVKNALVLFQADDTGQGTLLAFVTGYDAADNARSAEETLKQKLQTVLPVYMTPSRIISAENFPLLPNGKIDQLALLDGIHDAKPVTEPETETETKLLLIWKELLGDELISTGETFQSYGGNSIGIMRLIGRIYNEFKVRVPLNELFDKLTIKKLAILIGNKKRENILLITKAPVKPWYPLSSAQQRLYYEYVLDEDSRVYNLPMVWEIKNNYDKQKLTKTLELLVERHEGLRTSFIMENEGPVQVVHERSNFILEEIHTGGNDIDSAIRNFIRPFKLDQAPLLRAAVIITGNQRHIFVADIHHIICDGMSQSILMADFAALYQGISLPGVLVQYKDYAEWEHQFRLTEAYIMHRQFWLQVFEKEVPVLALPTLAQNLAAPAAGGGNIFFEIPKSSLGNLLSFLRGKEITAFSGLFSLYFLFMSRITGQEDIVIGTMSSGRTQKEVEAIPGMFVKTLPVRQYIDPSVLCADFIEQVHRFMVQATNAQVYDLSDIMIALNRNSTKPVTKLFDVAFTFHNYEMGAAPDAADDIVPYAFENTEAKYPVMLYAEEKPHAFHFRWEYASSKFTREDCEWLAAEFRAIAVRVSEGLYLPVMDAIGSETASSQLIAEDISFNF
jgi:mycobactin peptide synthetase MbtE